MDKVDKIILSKEDLPKLLRWRDDNKDLVRDYRPTLTEGVIEYEDFYKQYFKGTNNTVQQVVFIQGAKVIEFMSTVKNGHVEVSNVWANEEHFLIKEHGLTECIQDVITVHASLMAYIAHYKTNREYVHVSRSSTTKNKGSGKKGKRVIKISKSVYRIYVPDKERGDKREYNRHIESWTVRGHWRTYKSGKRVWVKPHTKGKGSNEPKEYKL